MVIGGAFEMGQPVYQRSERARDRGLVRPRPPPWPLVLGVLIVIVGAVTAGSFLALRKSTLAQERLLEVEAAALASVRAAETGSQARGRLAHEALLTPTPSALAEAEGAYAELAERLLRLRPLVQSAEERSLLARIEATQDTALHVWRELVDARQRGEPIDRLAALYAARLQPLRAALDVDYAQLAGIHEAALARGRVEVARVGLLARVGLGGAALVALAVGIAMILLIRRSLRALLESELRYRDTFEHAAVGIANVGLDGRWLRVNRRFEEILGYSEDELRSLSYADITHPDDVGEALGLADRLIRGEVRVYAMEKRYVRKDGRTTWVNLTTSLVNDPDGAPRHFVSAAEQIDARRAVEDELRDAVRARDEFLHIASHELRTPLTSLGLQLDGLRGSLSRGPLDAERLAAKAESARRQVRRLGALVAELLDVSRLADGAVPVEAEEGDLVATARAVTERFASDAARARTTLRLVAPDAVRAYFDPVRFEQALTHLVANALKYGAGQPVDVLVQRDGGIARVLVRDRGIGIDPEARERIFGRFERAVSSRHYGGLGLGLFLARRIIEAHGGRIAVDSAPGEGATFALEIPVDGPPERLAAGA
jgi:PAS domain S-box-containing protein